MDYAFTQDERTTASEFLEKAKTSASSDPQKSKTLMEAYHELCKAAAVRIEAENPIGAIRPR